MRAALRGAARAARVVHGRAAPVALPMLVAVLVVAVLVAVLLAGGEPLEAVAAVAAPLQAPAPSPIASFNQVLTNARNVLMGVLVAAASLAATYGGIRYIASMGDPSSVEQAKNAFKAAAVGYGLAVLAPVFVAVLRSVIGAG